MARMRDRSLHGDKDAIGDIVVGILDRHPSVVAAALHASVHLPDQRGIDAIDKLLSRQIPAYIRANATVRRSRIIAELAAQAEPELARRPGIRVTRFLTELGTTGRAL